MSFFFDDVTNLNGGRKKEKNIPINTAKQLECTICPLKRAGAFNPNMPAWGSPNPTVYFLGEAPGEFEDKENRPFIGPSGHLLKEHIPQRFEDHYRLNNTVRSRPPANRPPTEIELACCRKSIVTDIHTTKPKVIVAVGLTALNWLFEDSKDEQQIAHWRGRFFPLNIEGYVCWGYCILHPSFILRNQKKNKNGQVYKGTYDYLFEADMKALFGSPYLYDQNQPNIITGDVKQYLKGIEVTEGLKSNKELDKVLEWLDHSKSLPILSVDIETNMLKPYPDTSQILTMSVGTRDWNRAFPIDYPNAWSPSQKTELNKAIRQFLEHDNVKIAHNAMFELEWCAFHYGHDLTKIMKLEDTYAMAYVIDERRRTHSLDFLVRLYFGFWLKTLSNLDRKKMATYALSKILPYNALDTKWTFALYERQLDILNDDKKLLKVYHQLLPMLKMLTRIQLRGVEYNEPVLKELYEINQQKLQDTEQRIWQMPEALAYKNIFNKPLNIGSSTSIASIFTDVLKQPELVTMPDGKISTDEPMLSKIDTDLAKSILEWRGYAKVISTYLEPFPGFVMPDGRIHTSYNLYETSTGRLCVAKGTRIEIMRDFSNQPLGIPVEQVKAGDYAYTYDNDLNIVLRKVTWAGKTGTKKVMRLHWIGDGHQTKGHLDLTCNHPIRLINGEYCRADQICVGDRVLSLTRTIKNGRSFFYQTGKKLVNSNQRFIYEQFFGEIPKGYDIHHKDHNSLNDVPSNLEALSNAEHFSHHAHLHWANPENVVAMVETRRKGIEAGTIYVPAGENHVAWKHFTRYQLLRLIAKSSGDITRLKIDYGTFLNKCKFHQIDYKHCCMRFSKSGTYASKARMLNLAKEFGPTRTSRVLGIDYTKLTLMLRSWGYVSPNSTGVIPTKIQLLRALSKARGRMGNLKGNGFSDLYKVKKYADHFNIDLKTVKQRYTKTGDYIASTVPNNHKIVKIEWLKEMVDVYDLGVEDTHNFIANGLCISNSSDSPNLQNLPSKTGKEPRGMIKSPKGHVLVCCDYGQIEARLIGLASQDKNFCKALWESYDVHYEWAQKIAHAYPKVVGGTQFLDDKKAMKKFRGSVKNLWVFPAFYGASYRSIAAGLHLPEDLTQELFEEFWDQFSGVKKWQNWLVDRYNALGYAETLFGRRRHGPLSHNAIINSPIQGSASDICVLSMVDLNNLDLEVVMNVHDEIAVYVPESEVEESIEIMSRIMTTPRFDWINIPIAVEIKIGYDWFNMEEVLVVDSTQYYDVPKELFDFRRIYDM